jgi:hypothetical protein
MQAYLNDSKLKERIIAQLQAHYDADEIVQGKYWENGKGCAVGCILHDAEGNHHRFEEELGIPRVIARLMDRIFEGLTNGEAKIFPLEVMRAIPVNADLSNIWNKFALWMLSELLNFATYQPSKDAIQSVISLYERELKGDKVSTEEWQTARRAAYAAAAAAAFYADADAAAYGAEAAAAAAYGPAYAAAFYAAADAAFYAAAYAAAYAAEAAYADTEGAAAAAAADADAAYAAAMKKFYQQMASKLIELLKDA